MLVTVFLGFTKDPYPCVREAALDGLVNLSKSSAFEDRGLVEGCYYRALELLGDVEACVRCAAIRTVCDWGHILVAFMQGTEKKEQSDAIFIQLNILGVNCSGWSTQNRHVVHGVGVKYEQN